MSIKHQAVAGVKWTSLSTIINAGLHIVQLMILARYLSPHDFGLIAILMVVITFGQTFVDFGLSQAIVHKQNIHSDALSTLYWLNIILSIFIFVIIYFSSPFIASFYNELELNKYIVIVSSILIVQAFGQQFRTLFQKELLFSTLAKIDIFAVIISFSLSVLLAVFGYGIYALILPLIVMAFVKATLLIIYGIKLHKPRLVFDIKSVKELLVFGGYTVGDGIANTIVSQLDVILIGKLLGTETLGIYNIAKDLILKPAQLINPIITKISFPVMAKYNHDISEVKRVYLKVINSVASVNFPIYVATFLLAKEVVTIFLGVQWLSAVEVFKILAIWALIRSIGNPVGSLLLATGKPKYAMYWNISMLCITPIAIYIGSFWGIVGIAWINVISMLVLFIPGWYFLIFKVCNATLMEYIKSFITPLWIVVLVGIIAYLVQLLIVGGTIYNMPITLLVGGILIVILYRKFNKEFYITATMLIKGK